MVRAFTKIEAGCLFLHVGDLACPRLKLPSPYQLTTLPLAPRGVKSRFENDGARSLCAQVFLDKLIQ